MEHKRTRGAEEFGTEEPTVTVKSCPVTDELETATGRELNVTVHVVTAPELRPHALGRDTFIWSPLISAFVRRLIVTVRVPTDPAVLRSGTRLASVSPSVATVIAGKDPVAAKSF